MLRQLFIKNLAVVEALELQLEDGFTVFTGETGAGKSILVEALGLALGDRADSNMIRSGADGASVTGIFEVPRQGSVAEFLRERGVEEAGECIIRRHLSKDGRSRGFINDNPVSMGILRELGALLVDIHSQHEHQSLLNRTTQRRLLDEFAAHDLLLERVTGIYAQWRAVVEELDALRGETSDVESHRELLEFQLDELARFDLAPEAIEALEHEHSRLANQSRLNSGVEDLLVRMEAGEGAARDSLAAAQRLIEELKRFDPELDAAALLVSQALVGVDELCALLRRYLADLESEPGRLQSLDETLGRLHDLARKHRCKPAELAARAAALKTQFDRLDETEQRLAELESALQTLSEEYQTAARELHESRRRHAERMGAEISRAIQALGIPDGELQVRLTPAADAKPRPHGLDEVEFVVTTNAGEPHRPLSKIVSGGELSRISLAIHVNAVGKSGVETLVFDEVDAGIGGRVAEMVGRQLRALGEHRQVLCVTHLPQVASLGRDHLLVTKTSSGRSTQTAVRRLAAAARTEEIARMLSGAKLTEQSLAHARAMLSP